MKEHHREQLKVIATKMAEQAISDLNPENWPGHGNLLNQMDQETRGNALWSRKVAVQTLALFQKVSDMVVDPGGALGKNKPNDGDIEKTIERYEKQARDIVSEVVGRVSSK